MAIRNRLLYEKMLRMTKAVIDFLEKIPEGQYPTKDECIYIFKESGFKTKTETKTDFAWLLFNLREKISELLELKECSEYMVNNPIMRKTFRYTDKAGNPLKNITPILVYDCNLRFFLGSRWSVFGLSGSIPGSISTISSCEGASSVISSSGCSGCSCC